MKSKLLFFQVICLLVIILVSLHHYEKFSSMESNLFTSDALKKITENNYKTYNTHCSLTTTDNTDFKFTYKYKDTIRPYWYVSDDPLTCGVELSGEDIGNNVANCSKKNTKLYDPAIVEDVYMNDANADIKRCQVHFKPKLSTEALTNYIKKQVEYKQKTEIPVDCKVNDWSEWSNCNKPCGGGQMTRTRTIRVQPQYGGMSCPSLSDVQDCNANPCPVNCSVSDWGGWSKCDKECGGGTQTRTRTVTTPAAYGGNPCPSLTDVQECNKQECNKQEYNKQEYGVSQYVPDSQILYGYCWQNGYGPGDVALDLTFGIATFIFPMQYVEKIIISGLPSLTWTYGRRDNWIFYDFGSGTRPNLIRPNSNYIAYAPIPATVNPNTQVSYQVNQNISWFSVWCPNGGWGAASPPITLDKLKGVTFKFEGGNSKVDCEVSSWGGWSSCSKTCGGGTQTRTRTITKQPSNGGQSCPSLSETQTCNNISCNVKISAYPATALYGGGFGSALTHFCIDISPATYVNTITTRFNSETSTSSIVWVAGNMSSGTIYKYNYNNGVYVFMHVYDAQDKLIQERIVDKGVKSTFGEFYSRTVEVKANAKYIQFVIKIQDNMNSFYAGPDSSQLSRMLNYPDSNAVSISIS
jgi:hypothetical protein